MNENKNKRKYYEVWGDTLKLANFFKTLSIILVGICVLLLILLKLESNKPPIIIKVDDIGKTEVIKNWKSDATITKPELVNFTKTFVELYTGYDFYSYDDNFKKAFSMMTPEMQKSGNQFFDSNSIIKTIQQLQLKTKVNVSSISIEKDNKDTLILKAKGYREQKSYLNPEYSKEIIFESDIILAKTERTMDRPYGLLVHNYIETIIKEK